ncbi:MAG: prepilin-type N-terminal cleavage/methylation domain-containing protein, partial [Elusimicrobiota bacterium]|nr:prepilin-type N-terminal cleavage/methylation domain-containing protein [Elusimicrobiota bacterium]
MFYNHKKLKARYQFPSCGFTLIELLVVVLIIGILAAIAFPQYRKAVNRSNAAEQIIILKTVNNAIKMFKLVSGRNPYNYGELDISFPSCSMERHQQSGITYLICDKFSSVIETTGKATFIGPLDNGFLLGIAPRKKYVLYMPIATDQIICIDGRNASLNLT